MPHVTEQNLTDIVKDRWAHIPDPRLRKVMISLITHLHGFVRDVEPTDAEWLKAIEFLTNTGKLVTDKRQEFVLLSDTLGVSTLVDAINHRLAASATPTAIVGPFHIDNSPEFENGESMAGEAPGVPCFVSGKVFDLAGKPIAGAKLDIWQTDGEGLYEAQRDATDFWMRGIYRTGADGGYLIRTVAPVAYAIPLDGTVGELFAGTGIGAYRPAHFNFLIEAPGYSAINTLLFQKGDPYLETDVVHGVKDALIVAFEKNEAGAAGPNGETMRTPFYVVRYDFRLQPAADAR